MNSSLNKPLPVVDWASSSIKKPHWMNSSLNKPLPVVDWASSSIKKPHWMNSSLNKPLPVVDWASSSIKKPHWMNSSIKKPSYHTYFFLLSICPLFMLDSVFISYVCHLVYVVSID